MQTHRFNDAMTHDTTLEKVFFRPLSGVRRALCRFSILFIYICHKCHKCHRPLFAGDCFMTLHFGLVSLVSLVALYAGGVS